MQTDSSNIHGDHGIHDGPQVEWQKERIGHLEMALAHLLLSHTLIKEAETHSNAARNVLNGGQWIIPPESGTIPLHKESLDRYEYLEWKAKQHGLLLKKDEDCLELRYDDSCLLFQCNNDNKGIIKIDVYLMGFEVAYNLNTKLPVFATVEKFISFKKTDKPIQKEALKGPSPAYDCFGCKFHAEGNAGEGFAAGICTHKCMAVKKDNITWSSIPLQWEEAKEISDESPSVQSLRSPDWCPFITIPVTKNQVEFAEQLAVEPKPENLDKYPKKIDIPKQDYSNKPGVPFNRKD